MGQKTHPVGFRLPLNKAWRSNWYSGKEFANELAEDVQIRKYIDHRLPNAGVSKVEINRTSKVVTITIYTARPGIVIGKGGVNVTRLKEEINQLSKKNVQINISEVKRPELDAVLVGASIANQLIRKISYRRVLTRRFSPPCAWARKVFVSTWPVAWVAQRSRAVKNFTPVACHCTPCGLILIML